MVVVVVAVVVAHFVDESIIIFPPVFWPCVVQEERERGAQVLKVKMSTPLHSMAENTRAS